MSRMRADRYDGMIVTVLAESQTPMSIYEIAAEVSLLRAVIFRIRFIVG